MRENDICVTASPHLQRLTAAHGNHLDFVASLSLEQRYQGIEQSGVTGRCRGRENYVARLARWCGGTDEGGDPYPKAPLHLNHRTCVRISPLVHFCTTRSFVKYKY